jgi:tetratricopeptide (TPR) repeat protein
MSAPFSEPAALAANSAGPLARFRPSRQMQFLLVAVLSVLPYLPSLNFGFVYDDDAQVLQNPLLSSWNSLPTFFTHQSWSFLYPAARADYYRPVLLIWLTLNRHLFGLHPAGWHFASLCLHGAIAGLLFLLLLRHGFPSWIAFVSALYFGLHPAHIESVAWISGSTDLLACLGMLASLLLWRRSVESRSLLFLLFSLFFYFFALLSKEVSIVFPGVVFTYAWLFPAASFENTSVPRRSIANAFQKTIPFVMTASLFLLLRGLALHTAQTSDIPFSFRSVVVSAPSLLLFYLGHLIWPAPLSLFYNFYPSDSFGWHSFWLPLVVIASLLALFIYLAYRWHDRSALAAFAWLLFPLAPVLFVSFFPPNDIVHDRYLYIPSIGAALFLAIALRAIVSTRRLTPRSLLLPISVALALMAGSTVVQSRPWKDDLSLYDHACSLSPNHALACNNLAVVLIGHGENLRARSVLLALLQIHPDFALANANMGTVSYHLGDFPAAEQYLRRAISLDPEPSQPYLDLAMTCYRTNRIAEAVSLLRQAIAHKPDGEGYHLALGSILMEQNDFRDACNEFRTELSLNPHLPAAATFLSKCEQRLAELNHSEPTR